MVVLVTPGAQMERSLADHKGVYMTEATSAFQAEIVAADMAVQFARQIQRMISRTPKRGRIYK